jgi:hypothetical protein
MFIFRYEHNRKVCTRDEYTAGGESLTGHGTFTSCGSKNSQTPNFGLTGMGPRSIMEHERCAVTANQYHNWVGEDRSCDMSTLDCEGDSYCYYCPSLYRVRDCPDWDLIAYWVEDNKEGIDWREDNNQIVFNPEFSINMGAVTFDDVEAFSNRMTLF